MYTSFISPVSLLSYSVYHCTHVCSLWFMGSTWPAGLYADPLASPRGVLGGFVLEMITGTLYTVYSYIHTVSLFRGLTVSIVDAVYTRSFHVPCSWIVTFTFDALSTWRSCELPWPTFSCPCLALIVERMNEVEKRSVKLASLYREGLQRGPSISGGIFRGNQSRASFSYDTLGEVSVLTW